MKPGTIYFHHSGLSLVSGTYTELPGTPIYSGTVFCLQLHVTSAIIVSLQSNEAVLGTA